MKQHFDFISVEYSPQPRKCLSASHWLCTKYIILVFASVLAFSFSYFFLLPATTRLGAIEFANSVNKDDVLLSPLRAFNTTNNTSNINETSDTSAYSNIMVHVKTLEKKHMDKNLVVVGDVHGCLHALNQLLHKLHYNHKTDHLIFTGDVTTKGPNSRGVIRRLKELGATVVRGNQDDKVIRWMDFQTSLNGSDVDQNNVLENMKDDSEHYDLTGRMSSEDFAFMLSFPIILIIPDPINAIVVHGGLDPYIFTDKSSLHKQDPWVVMNVRNIKKNGRPIRRRGSGRPWAEIWNKKMKGRKHKEQRYVVVYGHDAGRGLKVRDWAVGLDTGCVYGRRLTAFWLSGPKKNSLESVKCQRG